MSNEEHETVCQVMTDFKTEYKKQIDREENEKGRLFNEFRQSTMNKSTKLDFKKSLNQKFKD